jgi:hypothetical protein
MKLSYLLFLLFMQSIVSETLSGTTRKPTKKRIRKPTKAPTKKTPSEEIACKFIKQPSIQECRKIKSFEGFPNGCTIPSEIGLLTALTSLSFYEVGPCISGKYYQDPMLILRSQEHQILISLAILLSLPKLTAGTIPSTIGRLTGLRYLSFQENFFTGTLPSEIGRLTALTYLDFSLNQLSGSIPSSIFNLSNLRNLALWSNKFSGSIPSNVKNLSHLEKLGLSDNRLTGSIPFPALAVTAVKRIDLSGA